MNRYTLAALAALAFMFGAFYVVMTAYQAIFAPIEAALSR